jgi:hypothetical protein
MSSPMRFGVIAAALVVAIVAFVLLELESRSEQIASLKVQP